MQREASFVTTATYSYLSECSNILHGRYKSTRHRGTSGKDVGSPERIKWSNLCRNNSEFCHAFNKVDSTEDDLGKLEKIQTWMVLCKLWNQRMSTDTWGWQCTSGGIGTPTSLTIHEETICVIQDSKNITRNMESAWPGYQHLETALRYTAHLSLNKTVRRDIRVQKARNKRARLPPHGHVMVTKKSLTSYYCPPSSSHAARNILESVITQVCPSWIL